MDVGGHAAAAVAVAAPDVSMEDDDEVIDLSSSSGGDTDDSDDDDWVEEDEGGEGEAQDQRGLIKDLRNRLRVSLQKNKRRGERIQKMKDGPATKAQLRRFLKGYYSQGYTNWILSNRGTLLRKKKGRVTRQWSHTGMSKIPRS